MILIFFSILIMNMYYLHHRERTVFKKIFNLKLWENNQTNSFCEAFYKTKWPGLFNKTVSLERPKNKNKNKKKEGGKRKGGNCSR